MDDMQKEGVPMKDLGTSIVLISLESYYELSIQRRVWERRQESEDAATGHQTR